MLQNSLLNLRAHHLASATDGRVAWHPTSEVYAKRVLIVLSLWLATCVLWLCTVEMPWQWEARKERHERQQRLKLESEQRTRELFKQTGRLSGSRSGMPPTALPSTVSEDTNDTLTTQESVQFTKWRLQVPGWLTALTIGLLAWSLYWPISTWWNRVILWRDVDGNIWMRFWFLWPRTRSVGHAHSTRLIPRVMQVHQFYRRRHLGTQWYWVLQITSDLMARLPGSPDNVPLTFRAVVPDLVVADQAHDASPGDAPPKTVQQWIQQVTQLLGIRAEQLRITPQKLQIDSEGRPIRISREVSNAEIPISRTKQKIDLDGISPDQLQSLIRTMSQFGQVHTNEDGHIEIAASQTTSAKDLSPDEMKALLAALPPELRKLVQRSIRKSK